MANPYHTGGGFVQNSPYGSQESPGGTKKRGNSTIRPVTILQLNNAEQVHSDADWSIDGFDVGQVLVVGLVMNVSVNSTANQYTIGDGTGYIDVRDWIDSQADEGTTPSIEQDKYIAVLGSIKSFSNKRHINAQSIRRVTDMNEIQYHALRALYVSLSLKNPGRGGGANGHGHAGENGNRAAKQSDYSAGVQSHGGNDQYAHLPKVQRRIMEVVSRDDTDEGMHVSAITKVVAGNGNTEEVMEAVEALMNDGMLFSTIDDLHVKSM